MSDFGKLEKFIASCKTAEECEAYSKKLKKEGFQEAADKANLRAAQLRKQEYDNGGRRPDIDYHILGLKDGDAIYLPELDIEATVCSHRTLWYKNREIYITPLEEELISQGHPSRLIRNKWRMRSNDRLINDAYTEIYPK
jgi:hypothetical protein